MKKLLSMLVLSLGLTFALSGSAAAVWNPFADACNSGSGENSAVCKDSSAQSADAENQDPLTGPDGLIIKIANFVAVIAGIAGVIIIILAGLRMVTSGGSTEDIAGARRTLIYTLVGLAVVALARTIISLILGML